VDLIYSYRQLSIDNGKGIRNVEMETRNLSTKMDSSVVRELDGFEIQLRREAEYAESDFSLISTRMDKLGYSVEAMKTGLDELNLTCSGTLLMAKLPHSILRADLH
jgi:hypothetical protein